MNSHRKSSASCAVIAAVLAFAAAPPAAAQTVQSTAPAPAAAPDASGPAVTQADTAPVPAQVQSGLADIVVTATKRGEVSLQKVPIAISAYSAPQLEAAGIRNMSAIDIRTPGLVFTQNSSSEQPFIRGIGTDFAGPGLEPPIAVYLDDVYWQCSFGGDYDLVDISSVQVLKGPQGTLYGRNATGGAIIVSTNNPVMRDEGKAFLEYGSLDHKRLDLVLNKQLADDLAFRIAGRYADQDGYVHNPVTGTDYGLYRNYTARGKLLYNPAGFSALLTVGYSRSRNRGGIRQANLSAPLCLVCNITGATPPPGKYQTYQGDSPLGLNKTLDVSLRLEAELGSKLTLTSVSSYRRARVLQQGTDETAFGNAPPGQALEFLFFLQNHSDGRDILQEFRLGSKFDGRFNFLVGVTGQRTTELLSSTLTGAIFGGLNQSEVNRPHTTSASAYAEVYYDLTDQLRLTGGGRYNYDRKTVFADPGGVAEAPNYRYKASFKNFSPRAVVEFKPDNLQNYYFSYTTGFKSGGFNLPSFANSPNDFLKPEKINSFELGAKNSLLENRIHTTLALFYYRQSNIQVSLTDPIKGSIKENAGRSRGYGAEFDLQFEATDRLILGGGYAYLNAKYTKYPNASIIVPGPGGIGLVPTTVDASGQPLSRAPKNTVYGSGTYNFPLSDSWKGAFNATARYTTKYDFNPVAGGPLGLDRQKAFALVNITGSIGPDSDKYKVGFYVNNLFNQFYLQNASTNFAIQYIGAALPRTYGVNFALNF